MEWEVPIFSRAQVDAAGKQLTASDYDSQQLDAAFARLNNWRAAHAFPLNTFQMGLRHRARKIDERALVAQRLKRVSSILFKLRRFPRMRLSQMQDIGGCRAVVRRVSQVVALESAYLSSRMEHDLVLHRDYISAPKQSGYRGIHLIYRYRSDYSPEYQDLLIEIQLRSRIQHAWATAVETVGTIIEHALKASEGPERWLEFFQLTSSAFAHIERAPRVPGLPPPSRLYPRIRRVARELKVEERLRAYRYALRLLEDKRLRNSQYFLLELNPANETLQIFGYRTGDVARATEDYLAKERAAPGLGTEVVLVRSESVDSLRRSYPNYFLDTEVFLGHLHTVMGK